MSKMIRCKVCSKEIASNAKACPECGAKNSKPIYKKWWFWVIIVLIIGTMGSEDSNESSLYNGNGQEISQNDNAENDALTDENASVDESVSKNETAKPEEKVDENVPTEYKSALKKSTII